ncbi:hypothetical protein L596_025862 [Steinernema carpocapsae]|uniref:Peptidase M13 N-terminal domain-containing protein n=1 Tax=Steinernema carpocapsae TaxID=34508 RepID=A0A4U5M8Z5_STECR|nr:hypothetical protein L596_025862 [Steinernema carpocapsae]
MRRYRANCSQFDMFFAVLCSVLAIAATASAQCSEEEEGNRLRGTCTHLVEGNADCKLIQSLQWYASRLDNDSKPAFDLLIVDINNRVVSNDSIPMMAIVTLSAYKLMNYVVQHPEQRQEIEDLRLEDWGTVRDLFVVGAKVKSENVESVISELNGRYALLDTLEEAKVTFPNEIERIRIDELIGDLENQVALSHLPLTTRMAQIHQVFTEWFARYPYIKPYLLAQTPNIDRWGTLIAFMDVASQFYRAHTMDSMFARNGTMDSAVVSTLNDTWPIMPGLSRIERVVFRDFTQRVKLVGDDPAMQSPAKLYLIRKELKRILVTRKIRTVKLSDEFGTFGDLLDVNNFMSCPKNEKFGDQVSEIRRRRSTCVRLADRPSAGGDCELLSSLLRYSSTLPAPKMIKFDVILFKVNQTILADPNLNRTEALARAVFRIKDAVRRIGGLSEDVEFLNIGQWGTLHELFIAAAAIKSETLEYALAHLTPVLEQFGTTVPPSAVDDTNNMISEMTSILSTPSGSPELKYSVLSLTMSEYLIRQPSVYERLRDARIPDWGNVGMVLDVISQYYRLNALDKLFQLQNKQSTLERDLTRSAYLAPEFIQKISTISSDPSIMDLWKLEMIVREFRTHFQDHPDLNSKLRSMPIGSSYLFGTFGDLLDLYYFKSMKTHTKKLKSKNGNGKASNESQEILVQDNDSPSISTNRIIHEDDSPPGPGNCNDVGELFSYGSDHWYPLTKSLSDASDKFERSHKAPFRMAISRIHNRLLVSPSLTDEEKLEMATKELKEYVGYSPTRSSLISNLRISNWGTVNQLFRCQ